MSTVFKNRLTKQIIFYLCILIIWQAVVILKIWPEYIFPSPLKVFQAVLKGFGDFSFVFAILISIKRILIGYGISILIGGALGVLMYKFRTLDETIGSLILGIQTLPSICWLPLALIWFGLNERAIIFVVIMGALFSITMAVDAGFKSIPLIYMQAGRNMGAYSITLLRKVMLPASFPALLLGFKQGWSFAWRSLMAGELLFVSLGLGYLLMVGRELNDMAQVIAVMLVISAISIVIDKLVFGRMEQLVKNRWGYRRKN
jgi:NitT/TauT family transport system permease protein